MVAPTPAARPSRPSSRLSALVTPTIQSSDNGHTTQGGSSTTTAPDPGFDSREISNPEAIAIDAARTCSVSFGNADIPKRSSQIPVPISTRPPAITPYQRTASAEL